MYTLGLDHLWYHNQRQKEMLAEAQRLHLVQEALQARQNSSHHPAKILEYIGKKLIALSTNLEARSSVTPQAEVPVNQQASSCR